MQGNDAGRTDRSDQIRSLLAPVHCGAPGTPQIVWRIPYWS